MFSLFVRSKVTVNENVRFTDYAPRIRLPDCSKLTKNQENDNDVKISRHYVFVNFVGSYFVSHVMFSYWFILHVNIIVGS